MAGSSFDSFLTSLNAPLVANSPMAPTPTQANAATAIPFATIPNPPASNPANAAVASAPSRLPLFLALGAAGLLAWYFMRKSSHSIATGGGSMTVSRRRRSSRITVKARARKSGRFVKRRRASSRRRSGRKTVTWAR